MEPRSQLNIPAASCRTQGGGDWDWGERNASKRIINFQLVQGQTYLWKKAIWLKVSKAEMKGQQEAGIILEKASVSLLLPPRRTEASGRSIKSIAVSAEWKEGTCAGWCQAKCFKLEIREEKNLHCKSFHPSPSLTILSKIFYCCRQQIHLKSYVGKTFFEASYTYQSILLILTTLSLKGTMSLRETVSETTAGQSLQMVHITSPCFSQNRKQINERAAFLRTSTPGCFKQQVLPFPKTISQIEKCSSVIGWNHRLSEGPEDKKQQRDVG